VRNKGIQKRPVPSFADWVIEAEAGAECPVREAKAAEKGGFGDKLQTIHKNSFNSFFSKMLRKSSSG